MKLFAVYLGGKAKGAALEVHDVVFVVATSVKKAFPRLRELWFGTKASAHVDSWSELSRVDGYEIALVSGKRSSRGPKLFFVNVGFYLDDIFGEQHRFHFLVARDKAEAKTRARRGYAPGARASHLDNVIEIDDLVELAEIDGYGVELRKPTGALGAEEELQQVPVVNNVYWPLK